MKILIIEDERELSDNIVTFLSSENYLCEQAFTFADARMKVRVCRNARCTFFFC